MKTCPKCSFLMGDHESLCAACSAQPDRTFPIDEPLEPARSRTGSTLLLDPAVLTARREELQYRAPREKAPARTVVLLVVVLGALGVLGWMGMQGDGPLASPLVTVGLADPPAVDVPDEWVHLHSTEGRFDVELPVGAAAWDAPLDPMQSTAARVTGFRAAIGEEAQMLAVWTDLGMGVDTLRNVEGAGFHAVVDETIARMRLGEETVRRDALVSTGHAVDSVLANGEDATTRARFHLVDGRMIIVMTRGPEDGARDLTEAHARLVEGFAPQS